MPVFVQLIFITEDQQRSRKATDEHHHKMIQQKSTMADANINNFRELIKLQRQKILNILISCVGKGDEIIGEYNQFLMTEL